MYLSQRIWFLKLTYFTYIFQSCIITSNVAYAVKHDGYKSNHCGHTNPSNHCEHTNPNTFITYQCGRTLQISKLTKPLIAVGEEPTWDEKSRSFYFVDVFEGIVYRYFIDTKCLYHAKIGNKSVSVILPTDVPGKYLITYGDRIAILSWDGRSEKTSFRIIRHPDPAHPYPRYLLDDAKVPPNGGIFFYTIPASLSDPGARNQSTLFGIFNGKQKVLLSDLQLGNGLGFSCRRKVCWFYHSDTILRLTYKSLFDLATNTIKSTSVLLNFEKKNLTGRPDSLTVDKKGYVWIACVFGGKILKVNPDTGEVECSLAIPAQVDNLAFGRCPNEFCGRLNCLYATSTTYGLSSPTPYDGALLLIRGLGSEGVLPYPLKLEDIINKRPSFNHNCESKRAFLNYH